MAGRLIPLLMAVATAALVLTACGDDASANTTVRIHFSRFEPNLITARAGDPVTIILQNDDPIDHEWIVGPANVHERHRAGTEPYHDEIPTEVTIPALSTRTTTVNFEEAGDYQYICHLPGHEAYGMVGTLRVTEP